MNLDGQNKILEGQHPPAPLYTDDENGKIWTGLESLAREGRLKLIREVRDELRRLYPEALIRLESHQYTAVPRVGADLRRRYQALLSKYPDLIPDDDLAHDPADPWLIVTAQRYTYAIMTDELRENEQKREARHGPKIPTCAMLRTSSVSSFVRSPTERAGYNKSSF